MLAFMVILGAFFAGMMYLLAPFFAALSGGWQGFNSGHEEFVLGRPCFSGDVSHSGLFSKG